MNGWRMLLYKEVLRFWKVAFQTIAAPVLTSVLYMMIFGHVLEDHVKVYDNVPYTAFLLPGLIMMSVLQNAFANSSSSLVQSKIMGNIVFLLLTPLSHWHWYVAYVALLCCAAWRLALVFLPSQFGLRPCSTMHPFGFWSLQHCVPAYWVLWAWWQVFGPKNLTKWLLFKVL